MLHNPCACLISFWKPPSFVCLLESLLGFFFPLLLTLSCLTVNTELFDGQHGFCIRCTSLSRVVKERRRIFSNSWCRNSCHWHHHGEVKWWQMLCIFVNLVFSLQSCTNTIFFPVITEAQFEAKLQSFFLSFPASSSFATIKCFHTCNFVF